MQKKYYMHLSSVLLMSRSFASHIPVAVEMLCEMVVCIVCNWGSPFGQSHFSMSTAGAGDRTDNPVIRVRLCLLADTVEVIVAVRY